VLERWFELSRRGATLGGEVRGGLTTFMVMAYIIFLNPNIIAAPLGLDPVAVAAGTALIAGVMTIAMGVFGNYPFAIAAGLGLNAIVAFQLTGMGLNAAGAMGVVLIEGIVILLLVVVGLREAIMNGAVRRLRPKFMTVATMALGLIPIMWATGTGSDVMKRIAAPMIGGIFTSFLLELVVYPVIYEMWKWNFEIKKESQAVIEQAKI